MSIKWFVIANGVSFDLTDAVRYSLAAFGNLGMPPFTLLLEQGPLQHGATFRGYRVMPRLVPFIVDAIAGDLTAHFDRREELLDIFNLDDAPIQIRVEIDDSRVRQLDCYLNGGLSFDSTDTQGFDQRIPIELIAPNPSWYDPNGRAETFNLGGGADAFEVPSDVPTGIGVSTLDQIRAIGYPGSWKSEPQIRITGPITNPVITNETTGEVLDFTGITIAAGSWYEVDCRYGYKTILDETGANRLADLTDDSDLATFHLERRRAGEVVCENSIRVTGSGVNQATKIDFSFYDFYIGV